MARRPGLHYPPGPIAARSTPISPRLYETDEASVAPYLGPYDLTATSNDPGFTGGQQWDMAGDASTPANQYGSQAAEAWSVGHTGNYTVTVAVQDTGIDYTHADLYLNIWLNQKEIPYRAV